jgi:hypothetical protein
MNLARPLTRMLRRVLPGKPATLNTLWINPDLDWVTRACLKSMVAQGHRVRLFSYDPVTNVPAGVECADASRIVPRDRIFRFDGVFQVDRIGSVAVFADYFRYRMMQMGQGVWTDADVYFLRPLFDATGPVLSWEGTGHVCNAVMHLPPDSPVLADLIRAMEPPYEFPFWVQKDVRAAVLKKLGGRPLHPGALTYATFGPVGLTHVLHKHAGLPMVRPSEMFCPVHYRDVHRLAQPAHRFLGTLPASTVAIHLWNSTLQRYRDAPPPTGSFIDQVRAEGLAA